MLHLYRIARGIDVRHRCLHPVVDHNTALNPQFQTSLFRESGVRRDADGQHHHIRMKGSAVLQQHIHTAVLFLKAFHGISQGQLHTVLACLCVDKGCHIRIEGIHQLLGALDDSDIHAELPQIFRQFQTNKTAARQNDRLGVMPIDVIFDPEGILHGAQSEQILQSNAGEAGLSRLRTRGQDQLVIALFEFFSGLQIFYRYRFPVRVDSLHLVADLHVHTEPGEKALRCLKGQFFRGSDHISDVVRQTAVSVGNKA